MFRIMTQPVKGETKYTANATSKLEGLERRVVLSTVP